MAVSSTVAAALAIWETLACPWILGEIFFWERTGLCTNDPLDACGRLDGRTSLEVS